MRINELLSENQIDEISLGKKIATKAARFAQGAGDVIGGTLGGIQGAWTRGARAYQRGKQVVDPIENPPADSSPSGTNATAATPAPSTGLDPKKLRQQAAELTHRADEIEQKAASAATPAPAPQGTTSTYDPANAAADKAAKNQADAAQRNADIARTQQANAAQSKQDADIKAAADAANAKPAFQRTAADNLAIKAAADKGIHEDEAAVAEGFHSNFLGMMI